jgi:hypothetical protein
LFLNFLRLVLLFSDARKAITAINRSVGFGLEGNLGFSAASSANSRKIFSRSSGGILAVIAAGFAALRLVLEAALSIELLLSGGEYELLAAFLTG